MRFIKESIIHAEPERVFAFHLLPDALERLTPPGENVVVVQKADITEVGSRAIIDQKLFGLFPSRWIAEHTAYDPPRMFEDTQVSGPFAKWRHQHFVEPHAEGAVLRDIVDYEAPLGFLGRWTDALVIVPKLERAFDHRHEVTREWCESADVEIPSSMQ